MNIGKRLRNFSSIKLRLLLYFFFLQIFISFWILGIENDVNLFLYFCYHSPLIIVILLLFNFENYIPSLVIFSLFAQMLYLVDFIISHLLGTSFLGYYDYSLNSSILVHILVLLAHLTSIILVYFYNHIKPEPKHLVITFIYTFVVYLFVVTYVPIEYNINAIQTTYTILDYLPMYHLFYVVYHLFIIAIPTYILLLQLHKLHLKK
ncbi:MAG: hypothetical protein ACMXYB_01070 [Candidatus Woesearchaeota archaeon]